MDANYYLFLLISTLIDKMKKVKSLANARREGKGKLEVDESASSNFTNAVRNLVENISIGMIYN